MKKAIYLVIIATLIFSLLTACGGKSEPANGSETNTPDTPQVSAQSIAYITDFTNGVAFVQYTDDESTYCIDKTGKQLFKLDKYSIGIFAKFNGKVAMLAAGGIDNYVLCDQQGKIYTPADFDAARFVLDNKNHEKAFLDGYIILERKEESYKGTKIEISVMDSDFKTLVPFSTDFAEKFQSEKMNINGTGYCDGYLYYGDMVLDLKTGSQFSDRGQMQLSTPTLSYWANGSYGGEYEHLKGGDIYNEITGEVVAKAAESESISNITFHGNIGFARYRSDNGDWFNIVDQNGNAKFEPIKVDGQNIYFDGTTVLVLNYETIEKDGSYLPALTLKTYDILGNALGETVIENWKGTDGTIALNDGVIIVRNFGEKTYTIYNSALEILF